MRTYSTLKVLITVFVFMLLYIGGIYAYDPNRIERPLPTGTDPYPEGWRAENIGPITPGSDFCYHAESGQFYIKAYGREVFDSSPDEFGFIFFETSEDKQLTARIMDAEVVQSTAAKGFIMLRAGLGYLDPMIFLEVKTQNNNQVVLCWRDKEGEHSASHWEQSGTVGSTFDPPNCYPRWIRFVRQGLFCTGYHRDDVEGAQWKKLGQVRKINFKGSAYMGIGACQVHKSSSAKDKPAIMLFDNVSVDEIDIPYYTMYPAEVEEKFNLAIRPGGSRDIDITKVFGHALGEYFTITAEVTDRSIAEVYVHEKPADTKYQEKYGEEFVKYLNVKGLSNGVTTVKLYCTINGYSMQADYSLNISDGRKTPRNDLGTVPYGWDLVNLSIPIDPNLIWGQEFVSRTAPMVTNASVFFGAWEYDWGGTGTGHFASTPGNDAPAPSTATNIYVANAIRYTFREEPVNYKKLKESSTYPNPTTGVITKYMRNWFADYSDQDIEVLDERTSVDLAFLPANAKTDSALYSAAGGHALFTVSHDNKGPLWETGQGFWTERLGQYDGQKVRGFPFVTNVQAGDWLAYTVHTQRRGKYKITPVTAQTDDNLSLRFDINGVMQVKELPLDKGSSPSDWKSSSGADVELDEGKNQIKVIFNSAGVNFLGFKIAFIGSTKEVYSAVNYDTVKYVQPERFVDPSQMGPEEIEQWKEYLEMLEQGGLTDSQKRAIDSIILTYPYKLIFDNAKVINHYKDELEELGVEIGNSPQDTLNALGVIQKKLTNTIDSVEFVTTKQTFMKHIDGTSYLYKTGINPTKKVDITMKVDSLSNAGRATYAGIMLRPMGENMQGEKELLSNSPFISFAVGSYEGGRFSYRWDYNMDTKKLDNETIAQDIYLKIRLNEYAGYVTAYYSYDNLFWWRYLSDPLRMGFFGDEDDVTVGMVLTGGSFASDATLAALRARNFEIKEFENGEEFEDLDYADEMADLPLTMSSTDVREGTPVDISFNINKPGLVSLEIYNTYGVMVESIRSNQYMPFNKDKVTISHTIGKLGKGGVYMLRLDAPENIQYVKFRYSE